MKELAILIPYYKIEFFHECLQSVKDQSNANFDLYIFDDCSPNDPTAIVENLIENCFYHRFDNNLGRKNLAGHWERCIAMIPEHKWLMILGDDDVLAPECIQKFFNSLKSNEDLEIKVYRFENQIINCTGESISRVHIRPLFENSVDFIFAKMKGEARSSLSEYVFDFQNIVNYGFRHYPYAWHSDDMAVLQISEFGLIKSIPVGRVFIRSSQHNISSDKSSHKMKNRASFEFYKNFRDFKYPDLTDEQRNFLFLKMFYCVRNHKKNLMLVLSIFFNLIKRLELKEIFMLQNIYLKKL